MLWGQRRTCRYCHNPWLSSRDGSWLLAKVLALARVSGGSSCHPSKRKGPGISAEWLELDQNLPKCSLVIRLSRRNALLLPQSPYSHPDSGSLSGPRYHKQKKGALDSVPEKSLKAVHTR